ncbi:MAG: ribosomal protein S18-alanine N-acetyltransferase [Hungatella sp.]|jgi:ribosomal-protein-alanine N-acetyltransferase|nr:ribosomal protein S18-alanine N-acetyltransferase [Hungatella sp.]MCI9501606.1 ribosomal protein S18-alanine N-acetyltransferase [Hungatella sp.]MCI9636106.1 ribosomal protein S18-alanine N-acetyltransferase [Hungatella sp.]
MLKDDLDAVAELEQLSFSIPWSYENLEQGLSNGLDQYLVWEENGMAAGYINFRILAGEGEIERVAVHPLLRGRGFGRKLMEAMVEYASGQGVRDITLDVRVNNQTAINLYESCGFVKEAIRKDYYREPTEDAIIMWRRFA